MNVSRDDGDLTEGGGNGDGEKQMVFEKYSEGENDKKW